ncbi:MAG: hypothetical protein DWQ36_03130 [Acidobacteria bacterium]|nr:MAG: hypothetical protein DWQ30_02275 [Acidobacteriota bacterium]REK11113.1 MAG: hypothetical protein DWQ36_03130 [Acidobacteriota bacterium]
MSKMIQIRNVPDAMHRELKTRAAQASMSLTDYILRELGRGLQRPRPGELRARLLARQPVAPPEPVVEALRRERDAR